MGDERVRTIMNAMFDGDYRPRSHIVSRIETLMSNEEAQYIDVRHTPSSTSMSGQGIVLTATRVIYATWSVPNDHYGNTGTVVVTTWARRRLIKIEIKDGDANTDENWSFAREGTWPYGGVLSLEYEGHQSPIELPLRQHEWVRDQFSKIVPGLLADLDR